jgi:hypothetical protein
VRYFPPAILSDLPACALDEAEKENCSLVTNSDAMGAAPRGGRSDAFFSQVPIMGKLKYFIDHVWSKAFWTEAILDCRKCRAIGQSGSDFDVESVIWTRGQNYSRYSVEKIVHAEGTGVILPASISKVLVLVRGSRQVILSLSIRISWRRRTMTSFSVACPAVLRDTTVRRHSNNGAVELSATAFR